MWTHLMSCPHATSDVANVSSTAISNVNLAPSEQGNNSPSSDNPSSAPGQSALAVMIPPQDVHPEVEPPQPELTKQPPTARKATENLV